MRSRALDLLGTLAEKDLRDAEASVLDDHLYHTDSLADVATVLAPRIGYEMLTPYRSFFQREIPETDAARFREKPLELVERCKDSLTLRDDLCTVGTVISPEGVWKSRMADRTSRNTFFVAVARSLGIPAWIDRVTGYVLYKENGKDVAVDFESGRSEQVAEGTLKLDYTPIPVWATRRMHAISPCPVSMEKVLPCSLSRFRALEQVVQRTGPGSGRLLYAGIRHPSG